MGHFHNLDMVHHIMLSSGDYLLSYGVWQTTQALVGVTECGRPGRHCLSYGVWQTRQALFELRSVADQAGTV